MKGGGRLDPSLDGGLVAGVLGVARDEAVDDRLEDEGRVTGPDIPDDSKISGSGQTG